MAGLDRLQIDRDSCYWVRNEITSSLSSKHCYSLRGSIYQEASNNLPKTEIIDKPNQTIKICRRTCELFLPVLLTKLNTYWN